MHTAKWVVCECVWSPRVPQHSYALDQLSPKKPSTFLCSFYLAFYLFISYLFSIWFSNDFNHMNSFFQGHPKNFPTYPLIPHSVSVLFNLHPFACPLCFEFHLDFLFFIKFIIVSQFTFSCRNRWTTCPMNWSYLTTYTSSRLFILFCLLRDGCCHLRPPLWPWNMDPACWLGKGSRPSKPSA